MSLPQFVVCLAHGLVDAVAYQSLVVASLLYGIFVVAVETGHVGNQDDGLGAVRQLQFVVVRHFYLSVFVQHTDKGAEVDASFARCRLANWQW